MNDSVSPYEKITAMQSLTHYQAMAAYNQWMNRKLYALCESLPDAERKKNVRAPFDSIHGMFNHLLFGDRAWLKRFTGRDFVNKPLGEIIYEDFEEMRREHLATGEEILKWTRTLSEDWLRAPFTMESAAYKKKWTFPAWLFVTHLFNHQTHHRGQLTAVLWKMGIDFGVTDLPLTEGL